MNKTEVEAIRVKKGLMITTCVKYELGIQVPKGIKNAFDFDKKNGGRCWKEAVKIKLMQITDYQFLIAQNFLSYDI
jgi:hypothetical protein